MKRIDQSNRFDQHPKLGHLLRLILKPISKPVFGPVDNCSFSCLVFTEQTSILFEYLMQTRFSEVLIFPRFGTLSFPAYF